MHDHHVFRKVRPWVALGLRPAWSAAVLGVLLCASRGLEAQTDVEMFGRVHGTRPPPGYYEAIRRDPMAFQFSPENGWIRRGRAIARERARWRAAQLEGGLTAPQAHVDSAGALVGDLNVPVFLILYNNTDSASLVAAVPRDSIEYRLYGTHAPTPYSVHNYYRELSSDRLSVNGTVLDWKRVGQDDTYYEGGEGCNGLCSGANAAMASLIREMVQLHDSALDYGQFDNDGPDGVPNSGDDDGYVDAIVLIHPELDGTCSTPSNPISNIWAHKWTYRGRAGVDLETADDALAGGKVKIRDYIIQGGQGGDNGCTANQPQAMGVVAHETGHIFGLPDLYGTGTGPSEGIGYWGLMGTGNWRRPNSPTHMEAWSLAELGWITEVTVDSDTTLEINPVATSDTAFVIPINGTNEYFLLENRQKIRSEVNLPWQGLLIWHVDSTLIAQRRSSNTVNAFSPEALRLIQADGAGDLQAGNNRGDGRDPFPGLTGNTAFGYNTDPASDDNAGNPTYINVDSIQELTGGMAIRARISFARPSLITSNDTLAEFRLDGDTLHRFEGVFQAGTVHTLEMDSVQIANGGLNRYTWVSWSNGMARSHTFTASPLGDTIVATVAADFLLDVTVVGTGGSVASDPAADVVGGAFMPKDSTVTLVATVTTAGHVFEGWSGDVLNPNDTLVVVMTRPYAVTATFAAPLALSGTPDAAVMGKSYSFSFTATGGTGVYQWKVISGTLPSGLSLDLSGWLNGRPTEAGTFTFEVEVTSGSQRKTQSVTLNVTKPQLALEDVITELLTDSVTLSADDVVFLDLIGNKNGRLDLGDFLGWLEDQGTTAAALLRIGEAEAIGERRNP
ncbi:MAG: M6 family metalloprotease domain-containing protein [Gemmatimonadales bacterium]